MRQVRLVQAVLGRGLNPKMRSGFEVLLAYVPRLECALREGRNGLI